ncbi:TonB-dependent receptor [Gammaproteobacteria bacterium]|nr:TonB-dependent receptor [Gammaproteobacteria bacterium]
MFRNLFYVPLISFLLFSNFIISDEVEEVVVTGSYIKGSPTDGASPVELYDRTTIEAIGAVNVADITANMAVNSGSENNADSFTSGATQGRTNVNLRGLGLSSTLVLFDGRRQTVAGATANDGSVFVDTSAIPVIALERVEVLKEGAASVYGSDAVAGVVNYIFRRDFTGFEVDLTHQETDLGSQEDDRASFIWGAESGDTNFVIAYSTLDRSPLSQSELELAPLGISGLGTSFLLFGPSTVDSGPYAGTYSAFQNVPDPNCIANKGILVPQASGSRCGFVYGPRFNIVNDEEHNQLYASLKTVLTSGIDAELDYLKAETDVFDNPQSPSYPALSYLSPALAIAPGKGGNPFGVPALWLGRPLASAFPSPFAPREVEMERVSFGLSGTLDNGFDWDLHMTRSAEDSYGRQPDTGTSALAAAIDGTGGPTGDQTFNLFDPSANSQELRDWLRSDQETWNSVVLSVVDFVMSGQVGNVDMAVGLQSRTEKYDLKRSANSIVQFDAAGNLTVPADMIFLGGGTESDASRRTNAIFMEASTDLSDQLELKGAIRYEDLENDSNVDPKISVRYQASDDVVLRASVSTSFREPSLAQLYSDTVGLQGIQDFDTDGNTVGQASFIRIAQAGSTDLKPEEADNLNVGIIWYPTDNLEAKLDYWMVDYTNVITIESAQGIVSRTPNSSKVQRTTGGTLTGVTTSYFNASSVDTNGFDIELMYSAETNIGSLLLGLNATHMLQYEIPVGGVTTDVVGLFNHDNFARSLPETKAVLSANLVSGSHSAAAYGRWVSSYETTNVPTAIAAGMGFDQNIDSHFTVDLQYSYSFDFNSEDDLRLTLGVKNAFDEEVPQVYDGANWSYDPKHHDPRGRMFSVGLKLTM